MSAFHVPSRAPITVCCGHSDKFISTVIRFTINKYDNYGLAGRDGAQRKEGPRCRRGQGGAAVQEGVVRGRGAGEGMEEQRGGKERPVQRGVGAGGSREGLRASGGREGLLQERSGRGAMREGVGRDRAVQEETGADRGGREGPVQEGGREGPRCKRAERRHRSVILI